MSDDRCRMTEPPEKPKGSNEDIKERVEMMMGSGVLGGTSAATHRRHCHLPPVICHLLP